MCVHRGSQGLKVERNQKELKIHPPPSYRSLRTVSFFKLEETKLGIKIPPNPEDSVVVKLPEEIRSF